MIAKDQTYTRTAVIPGKSFLCGCDVVSTSGEVCRVHNQPIATEAPKSAPVARRFRNAVGIQAGASNALAVANSLVEAIREAREQGADWNCTNDSAVRLIAYQLSFLLKSSQLNDLSVYAAAMTECETRALS